jgi:hypothetical protein
VYRRSECRCREYVDGKRIYKRIKKKKVEMVERVL